MPLVQILNAKDVSSNKFDELEKCIGNKPCIVLIHAEWCPHCVTLVQPQNGERTSIWKRLVSNNPSVLFFEIEHEAIAPLMQQKQKTNTVTSMKQYFTGYPCFVRFDIANNSKVVNVNVFERERSFNNLDMFVKKASLPK